MHLDGGTKRYTHLKLEFRGELNYFGSSRATLYYDGIIGSGAWNGMSHLCMDSLFFLDNDVLAEYLYNQNPSKYKVSNMKYCGD